MKPFALLALALTLVSCSYLPITPLNTSDGVTVIEEQDYIDLTPQFNGKHDIGLMFWPGGLVDPHAYVASLSVFAAKGYHVVIAKVPLNLAITQIEKGYEIAKKLGGEWVFAGHSLGGTTAAWTIYNHLNDTTPAVVIRGLVLMASYPADSTPITGWTKPVISLYGSEDGLATGAKLEATKKNLPAATQFVPVAGGNHAQWGDYGKQSGDGTATIMKEEQWNTLASNLEAFWSTL